MSQDQRERDRLLTETHTNVQHIVEWSRDHDKLDDLRFKSVKDDIEFQKRIIYGCIGAVTLISFLIKFIP